MPNNCPRCGSEKIIPAVPLLVHEGYPPKAVALTVEGGPPIAFIIKREATGALTADICGECGRVELAVTNFRALYERHLADSGT